MARHPKKFTAWQYETAANAAAAAAEAEGFSAVSFGGRFLMVDADGLAVIEGSGLEFSHHGFVRNNAGRMVVVSIPVEGDIVPKFRFPRSPVGVS